METKGILHDDSQAARILKMTCDTLLLLKNDGTCIDMIVKTENNPYINNQYTLLGKNIFDHFPEETVRDLKPAIEHVARTGEVSNANYDLPAPDQLYFFKCIIQKYNDELLLCQYRDITKRSQMKRNLQMANERLTETGRAAKIGYWTYNTATRTFDYRGYTGILMKENERVTFTMDGYLKNVYPKDRERLEHFFGNSASSQMPIEYRIMKDDKLYYLKLKIVNIYRTDDDIVMFDGYTQNINDIVSKLDELKMVTQAVNNSNDSFFATKIDGTLVFANQFCRRQNEIPDDVDITKYKAYGEMGNFKDKEMWDNFIGALRANDGTLKYICNYPSPKTNMVSSCISYIIRNEYGEEIIWHIRRDISEQLRYEDQLKKAKEKAEESDRLKSAFLSNMSHEIRTPLNAIVGFSGIMADIDNAEERKKYFNIIESSNKRLLLLINEVLDLSKIESGTLAFDYTPVRMNDLFHEIFMTHQLYANQASLVLEIPEEETCIKTDKNRLTQVISNLLNNAVKFTPKGTITIGYRLIPDFVELYVRDTGIGIPKDKVDKIFNRFMKVDDFAPGTGLGLSICKTIVERLGGDISVVSEEGVGSLFSFRIPIEIDQTDSEEVQQQPLSNSRPQYISGENATILVAEDIDDNFELIRAIIGSQYRLLHAKSGKEAIELFDKYLPDLILMDIKIPEVNGLEAIKAIRRKSPSSPPIIAVSAYAFEEDKRELLDAGCNDFVAKPLDKEILLAILHRYL
ncbi:MAG: ATP-binding protein [Proteiniphilum sp.]|uniref:hybrid sensor histidine kinase/response regulator n=1 Tax=Proteiniphilum sp. TaxID=1926877 RepID=UPI002B1EC336|nr:ATP-binding protein [Proteiniphilum sp.]MEA5129449.1 ATP-binding protein [Proteiniphilum sp.]